MIESLTACRWHTGCWWSKQKSLIFSEWRRQRTSEALWPVIRPHTDSVPSLNVVLPLKVISYRVDNICPSLHKLFRHLWLILKDFTSDRMPFSLCMKLETQQTKSTASHGFTPSSGNFTEMCFHFESSFFPSFFKLTFSVWYVSRLK